MQRERLISRPLHLRWHSSYDPGFGREACASAVGWSDPAAGGTEDTEGIVNPGGTDTKPGTPCPLPATAGAGLGEVAANTLPIVLDGNSLLRETGSV